MHALVVYVTNKVLVVRLVKVYSVLIYAIFALMFQCTARVIVIVVDRKE